MDSTVIVRGLIPVVIALVFGLFRKYLPARRNPNLERYDRVESKRLPTRSFGFITVTLGLLIAIGGYFGLTWVNHLFAKLDLPVLLQVFPVTAIWCFLPGFAALAIPWPLVIFLLRRSRFSDDAAYVEDESMAKSGFDCYRAMVGMCIVLVLPIAVFTMLALPERVSFTESEVLWTHYASVRPERFVYTDARVAYLVDGYRLRDGSFEAHRDLVVIFRDGRRLSANAVGDGGSEPSPAEINLILNKTGLTPEHVQTNDEISRR